MLRFLDAGESHGKGLYAIIEGLPSNFIIRREAINDMLRRRQSGYGRGGRMAIEKDQVELRTGIRNGRTTGAPVTLYVENLDHANWANLEEEKTAVFIPRPGHADLGGYEKYQTGDIRDTIERSSARETAIRTAVGALAAQILLELGVEIRSKTVSLLDVKDPEVDLFDDRTYSKIQADPMRAFQEGAAMAARVDAASAAGDTLPGWVMASIRGCPKGLGSYVHHDRRLDAQLAGAVMGIQGIKRVSIGDPFLTLPGSAYHDPIRFKDGTLHRDTNHAGGIEGGMSNGEDIEVYAWMKPIPSVKRAMASVDLRAGKNCASRYERSDITAVVPAAVVLESVLAFEILSAILHTFSRDNREELHLALERRKQLGV